MNKVRSSILQVSLIALIGACGSETSDPERTGGTGGGSSAKPSGGATPTPNGGATSQSSGGSTGSSTGGSTTKPNGGSTAGASGGSTTQPNGGSTSSSSGGSTAKPNGGSTSGASGGATGNPSGGATASGGKQTGGDPGSGGSSGTGGATVSASALVTSANDSFWKTEKWIESTSGTADVTVNEASSAQDWEGFGGAFNEMGWNFLSTKAMQDEAIHLLFHEDGTNFAWGRIPMGASDYAMDRYTYDETPNDTSLANFSTARDKQKLLPFIKAAVEMKRDLRFWASPWTPPTWMKTPAGFDGGTMKSDEAILKAYAQYFVKFIQAYSQEGIKIEVVAPQNEPNYAQGYPSCLWSPSTFTTFVGKHLGPALTTANLSTTIMLGTLSNPDGDNADYAIARAVMEDTTAKSYIKVIGAQWGVLEGMSKLKAYNLPIWASEHRCGNYPWESGYKSKAPNDLPYAVQSWGYIKNAIKSGVTSYNAWNMVLDENGKGIDKTRDWAQNALLVASNGKIIPTPTYYVFRHFSQFANPGGKVVETTGGDAIGFKNADGSLVAVMYNSGSAKASYTVSIGGKKLQFPMPGNGWATVKYKP